jgi:hypothetical protein
LKEAISYFFTGELKKVFQESDKKYQPHFSMWKLPGRKLIFNIDNLNNVRGFGMENAIN